MMVGNLEKVFYNQPNMKTFADYKSEGPNWITLATGEYYPDMLVEACLLYEPVLRMFGQLLATSESSERLFTQIADLRESWMRIQLARVFRKYVSPETPVEMLKRKSQAAQIIADFGKGFRPIHEVQAGFSSRPIPDEVMCALLCEYKSRGKKGYDLTERFFGLFQTTLPELVIEGPIRAGKDVLLGGVLPDYPNPKRPVDFVIYDGQKSRVLAIGLARYDSDRGGSQEDDRTGGYWNCANEILTYAKVHGQSIRVIFVNDGPGLLLGSMWNDYAALEAHWEDQVRIVTLRMVTERLTHDWLLGLASNG
ncbi:MAG: hypothetical protein BroJett018_29670 [Chloroflexota bacterium]|nr:MAG: hypothetical protein BroJett018_29670 [Chloroflexota bacterium]